MNHIYRLVWNPALRTWAVASEIARGRGRRGSGVTFAGAAARPGGFAGSTAVRRLPLATTCLALIAALSAPGLALAEDCTSVPICAGTTEFNADSAGRIVSGSWDFSDSSRLNVTATGAIIGGAQTFHNSATLNAGALMSITGGTQNFYDTSALDAMQPPPDIISGVIVFGNNLSGGTQNFYNSSVLNTDAVNAISGGAQNFADSSVLNLLQTGHITVDGTLIIGGTIIGGTQTFSGSSIANAGGVLAITGGTQTFNDSSVLNAAQTAVVVNEDDNNNEIAGGNIAGGAQTFNNNSTLNASGVMAIAGGTQTFYGTSALNALQTGIVSVNGANIVGADISAGTQTFLGSSTLNANGILSIAGGTQNFYQTSALNATQTGEIQLNGNPVSGQNIAGGTQNFYNNSTLNASGKSAITGGAQTFHQQASLNLSAEGALHGGTQDFYDNSTLNAAVSGAVTDAASTFHDSSSITIAVSGALQGGSLKFFDDSSMTLNAANAVGTNVLTFYGNSKLVANVAGATSGTLLGFYDNSVLEAYATGSLGGTALFAGNSVLKAYAANVKTDGIVTGFAENSTLDAEAAGAGNIVATFIDNAQLNINASDGLNDSVQSFSGSSALNVNASNGVTGGQLIFKGSSTANINAANGLSGGTLFFQESSTLNVNAGNGISGGSLSISDNGTLNANVANAVSGGQSIFFSDNSVLNAKVANAVTGGNLTFLAGTTLKVFTDNAVNGAVDLALNGGTFDLNGYNETIGSLLVGNGSSVTNNGAQDSTLSFVSTGGGTTPIIGGALHDGSARLGLSLVGGDFAMNGANSYSGGTRIDGSTVRITEDGALGAASGSLIFGNLATGSGGTLTLMSSTPFDLNRAIVLDGTGTIDMGLGTNLTGPISGTGGLVVTGVSFQSTTTLSGTNSYTGGTTVNSGTLKAGRAGAFVDGTAYTTNFYDPGTGFDVGGLLDLGGYNLTMSSLSGTGGGVALGGATLTLDQSTDSTYGGAFSGSGNIVKSGAGTLTLTGDASRFFWTVTQQIPAFTGTTTVAGGTLRVDGALGGNVLVRGGVLAGSGSIAGNADLTSGGIFSGSSGQTLHVGGNVLMDASSVVDAALGGASNAALIDAAGNLTLDGTLNVSDTGGFGQGVYRLFNYVGSLIDNGLEIGATPTGVDAADLSVQTAVANTVNLVSSSPGALGFWDGGNSALHGNGAVDGGAGTWSADGSNWTQASGAANGPFNPNPTFAVFENAGGTVTVDGSAGAIGVTGMQFAADGYRVEGDALALQGDGGATAIRVGDGTAAGASMTATLASSLTGASDLEKTDYGTLILTGANSYTGGTKITAGTLSVSSDANLGDAAGALAFDGGTLAATASFDTQRAVALDSAGTIDVAAGTTLGLKGDISGAGSLVKNGDGTLGLWGTNTYSGGTTLNGGTLVANSAGAFGAGSAYILNGGTLKLNGWDATLSSLSGTGGTLLLGPGDMAAGNLTLDQGTDTAYAGALAGTMEFYKRGSGALTLTGDSSAFAGSTRVGAGTLRIDGTLGGSVTVQGGTLTGAGRVLGDVTLTGGALAAASGQTLRVDGDLALGAGSELDVALGAASGTALVSVGGNLDLNGTLNVTDAGSFGLGVYRLIDYGGALSGTGLTVGTTPSGVSAADLDVQTSVANQVNLVVQSGGGQTAQLGFWDGSNAALHDNGAVDGGTGIWSADGGNWTQADGAVNGAYSPNPTYAVFQNIGGLVAVDDSAGAIGVSGMQFAVDGYSLEGSAIALQGDGGATAIRVGDGTAAGASMIATIAAALTGDSTLVKSDLGTLVLTGANTYTGGTQVAAGTLVGNADAIRGDLANAGTVEFAQAADASFAGAIGGLGGIDGTMIKSGAGTLTLTGTSTLDWTIKAGGLSTDASRFTGNAAIQSGASLTFDQSASAVYAGVISGAGDFIKAGTGSLMLTGDSSAFTGTTLIEAGLLSINGQLGGTLEITGGKLGGNGTIGNLSVSGIVAPGNSIGTLHVGNVSLDPGSVYQVEVNAAGQSDQIIATGTATINGSTVQVLAGAGNYALQTQYTILTASGGRTGQFAGVTSNLAFLDPALSYDANNVYLTMTRNDTTLESVGRTRNQIAAAGGVDSLGAGNAVYDTVLGLSASQARSAFDQLSGELQASAQTALIEDSRFVRNAANDRLRAALGATGASRAAVAAYGDNRASGLPAQAAPTHGGPVFWSSVYGSWSRTGGDGNAAGLNRSSSGLLMGMDGKAGDWRLGVLTGYGQTGFDTSNPSASGSSKDYHLGAYGGTAWGNLSLRTGMAYTWHDIDTRRSVAVPGLYDSLKNHYRGGTLQAFGELAYGAEINGVRVEPYANIARVRLRTGSSGEQGGATALQTGKSADNITYTTLGVRAEHEFEIGSAQATLTGSLGWRHASGDLTPTVTQRFAGGSAFTVGGVPIARDSAVIEAGLDVALSRNATLNISYSGQLAATARDHSVKANLSVRF